MIEIQIDSETVQSFRRAYSFTSADSSVLSRGMFGFFMPNTILQGRLKGLRPQDVLLFDIIKTARFRRPIYFASSVSPNGTLGLRNHLQMLGLAYKLVPYSAVQCGRIHLNGSFRRIFSIRRMNFPKRLSMVFPGGDFDLKRTLRMKEPFRWLLQIIEACFSCMRCTR